jgi:uncharacterized caspase-like protein
MSAPTPLGLASLRRALAVSLVLLVAGAARADQHALLIGVGSYKDGRVRKLSGPGNDIQDLRQLLVRDYGFPEANIHMLVDERATAAAIRSAFADVARACQPGDTVVFLFSGHGVQLPGDEIRDKAVAKALCPADVVPRSDGTADRTIGGDELGTLLDGLPANDVLVILDCCHATSGVKSLSSRASVRSFLLPTPAGAKAMQPRAKDITTPSMARALLGPRPHQQRALFFACTAAQSANELSHTDLHPAASRERFDFNPDEVFSGAFTYFLVQGLRGPADTNGDGRVSYREAVAYAQRQIDQVYNQDKPNEMDRQNPRLEVTSPEMADRPVFGGLSKRAFVAHLTSAAGNRCTLDLGAIHGLHPGAILGLYRTPAGDEPLGRPLGRLEIDRLGIDRAQAKLLTGGPLDGSLVVAPLQSPPPSEEISIAVETAAGAGDVAESVSREVQRRLGQAAQVRLAQQSAPDLRLTLGVEKNILSATAIAANQRVSGPNRYPLPGTPAEVKKVSGDIASWIGLLTAQQRGRQSLAWLSNPAPGFGLQAVVDSRPVPDTNLAQYTVGDTLKFGLKATKDCYYYIVLLAPDGTETLWCPRPGEEHFAPAGKKLLYPGPKETVPLDGPPGVYVVKLLAVRTELPAQALADGKPRAEFFTTLSPADWAESSATFRLVPR